jgi:hypothetical protein
MTARLAVIAGGGELAAARAKIADLEKERDQWANRANAFLGELRGERIKRRAIEAERDALREKLAALHTLARS